MIKGVPKEEYESLFFVQGSITRSRFTERGTPGKNSRAKTSETGKKRLFFVGGDRSLPRQRNVETSV